MRLRALSALSLALAASAMAGTSASADTNLPLAGFSHMVVDSAAGHIFVTGARSDSSIQVLDTAGARVSSIANESGAGGMVLDGTTLYVARCGWGVIDEIDTRTLTRTGSFPASVGGTCDIALAGGRLWYSAAPSNGFGDLESVSLDDSHTVVDTGRSNFGVDFATTPVHPDMLVVGDAQSDPPTVDVLDVSDPRSITVLADATDINNGGAEVSDMSITPDGSTLLIAAGAPYEIEAFSLPSLATAGVYPEEPYPTAVAVSPDGTKIAGGVDGLSDGIYVFGTGNATPARKVNLGGFGIYPYARGMAFSADGKELYAVIHSSTSAPVFRVLSTDTLPAGSLSIKASAGTINAGKSSTLTVHLATSSTNRTVSIYRQPVGTSSPILVTTGTVGSSGNFTYTAKPSQDTVYTARWAGDTSHSATTSSGARVNVRLVMHRSTSGGYRTSSGVRLYHFTTACEKAAHTGCPVFNAWSSPLQPGRSVSFVAQGRTSSGRWVTLARGSYPANSSGKLRLTLYYRSNGIVGVTQRIRFSIAKSSTVLGSTSGWLSFRVTR